MSQKGNGGIYQRDRSPHWWCTYSKEGKRIRESTGETDRAKAMAYLREELRKVDKGINRRPGAATFEDLAAGLRGHYVRNRRKSLDRVELALRHLERLLGDLRAREIKTAAIRRYTDDRLKEKAAPASINRELSALRKALRIARADGIISELPAVEMLTENNTRTGFLADSEHSTLHAELPRHLRPLLDAGFYTGWRKAELLSRRWHHVELQQGDDGHIVGGTLRLEPGETKNREGREFPLAGPLLTAIAEQFEQKAETERRTGRIVDALFFIYETGEPIGQFRKTWRRATERAGVPGLLFHDLRRSGARNMIKSGLSETVAMRLGGWKTRSIFDRYAIVDEKMIRSAAEQYGAFMSDRQEPADRQVVPLEKGAGG